MAETISGKVKQVVDRSPFIHEMLVQGILSYSNYAEKIKPEIEKMAGSPVREAAIVMALRRYADELRQQEENAARGKVSYQIVMRTNIFDVNLVRDEHFNARIAELYRTVSPEQGDFLNISMGNHEISLAVSEKYRPLVEEMIKGEQVLNKMNDLVAVTLVFTGDFLRTPGIVYEAVRRLAWEEVNVIEIVSTMNELTFVLTRGDSMKAFDVLQSFLGPQD